MKKTIWIDVTTTILWWTGHPTGVQRVVYNYARRLHDDPAFDARCFVLDGSVFREISFAAFEQRITENNIKKQQSTSLKGTIKRLPAMVRGHGLRTLKGAVGQVPVLGPAAAFSYNKARVTYRKLKRLPTAAGAADARIFGKDDTVLLMDGNWGDKGYYAREIVRARQNIGFRLCHLIHDFIAIKNPAYANLKADIIIGGYFKTVLPCTDTLICTSQTTLNDVSDFARQHHLAFTPNRHIVRLGDSLDTSLLPLYGTAKATPPSFVPPKEFILYVSTIEIRKNHHSLFYAYKLAAERGIDLPPVIIAGKKGWMVEETLYMLRKDSQISDKIIILFGPDDATRDQLYEKCLFTICPSFYEGWGLPVVESLAHGKLCIASDSPALREAGGAFAEYFSPFDTNELLQKLTLYSHDKTKRTQFEDRIKKEFTPYNWNESYQVLAQTLL